MPKSTGRMCASLSSSIAYGPHLLHPIYTRSQSQPLRSKPSIPTCLNPAAQEASLANEAVVYHYLPELSYIAYSSWSVIIITTPRARGLSDALTQLLLARHL